MSVPWTIADVLGEVAICTAHGPEIAGASGSKVCASILYAAEVLDLSAYFGDSVFTSEI